jgi:hypothetical protein
VSRRVSTQHARVHTPRYVSVSRPRRRSKPRTNSKEPAADCFACLSLAGLSDAFPSRDRFRAAAVSEPRPFPSSSRFRTAAVSEPQPFPNRGRFRAAAVSEPQPFPSRGRFRAAAVSEPQPFPSRGRFRAATVSEPRPFPSRDREGAVTRAIMALCLARQAGRTAPGELSAPHQMENSNCLTHYPNVRIDLGRMPRGL